MSADDAKAWLENKLSDEVDDSECGVGGYMFASEAAIYSDDIPLPPLSGGAALEPGAFTKSLNVKSLRYEGAPLAAAMHIPSTSAPFNPTNPHPLMVPMFPTPIVPWPQPEDVLPFRPTPWQPPFTDPKDEQRRMDELAALLKKNSSGQTKEKKLENQVAKLKAEVAELKAEVYYLRHARAVLESTPVYPTMISGPFPIFDVSYEANETVQATILHHMLTLAEWDELNILDKAKRILAYVEAANYDQSVPSPRQYQINLEAGKYA